MSQQLSTDNSKLITKITNLSIEDRKLVEYVINAEGVIKAAIIELTEIPRSELKSVKTLVRFDDIHRKRSKPSEIIEFVKELTEMPMKRILLWKKLLFMSEYELRLINSFTQFSETERTFAANFIQWYFKQNPFKILTSLSEEDINCSEGSENIKMNIPGAEGKFQELLKKYILDQGNTVGKIVTKGVNSDGQCYNDSCDKETPIEVKTYLPAHGQCDKSVSDERNSMEIKRYFVHQGAEVGKFISTAVTKDKNVDTEKRLIDDTDELSIIKEVTIDGEKSINRTQINNITLKDNKEQPQNIGLHEMKVSEPMASTQPVKDTSNNSSIGYNSTTDKTGIRRSSLQGYATENILDTDKISFESPLTNLSKLSVHVLKVDGSNVILRGKSGVNVAVKVNKFGTFDKTCVKSGATIFKDINNDINYENKSTKSGMKTASNTTQGKMNDLLNPQTLSIPKMKTVHRNVCKTCSEETQVKSEMDTVVVSLKTRSCVQDKKENECLNNVKHEQVFNSQIEQMGLNVSQVKEKNYVHTPQPKELITVAASGTNSVKRSSVLSHTVQGNITVSNSNTRQINVLNDTHISQATSSTVGTLQNNVCEIPCSNRFMRAISVDDNNTVNVNTLTYVVNKVQHEIVGTIPLNILETLNLETLTSVRPSPSSNYVSQPETSNTAKMFQSKSKIVRTYAKSEPVISSNVSETGIITSDKKTAQITESTSPVTRSMSQTGIGNSAVSMPQIASTSHTKIGNSSVSMSQIASTSVQNSVSQIGIRNSSVNVSQIASTSVPKSVSQTGIYNSAMSRTQVSSTKSVSQSVSLTGIGHSAINRSQIALTAPATKSMSQTGIRNSPANRSQITESTISVPKSISQAGSENSTLSMYQIASTSVAKSTTQAGSGNSALSSFEIASTSALKPVSHTSPSIFSDVKPSLPCAPQIKPLEGDSCSVKPISQLVALQNSSNTVVPRAPVHSSHVSRPTIQTATVASSITSNINLSQNKIANLSPSTSNTNIRVSSFDVNDNVEEETAGPPSCLLTPSDKNVNKRNVTFNKNIEEFKDKVLNVGACHPKLTDARSKICTMGKAENQRSDTVFPIETTPILPTAAQTTIEAQIPAVDKNKANTSSSWKYQVKTLKMKLILKAEQLITMETKMKTFQSEDDDDDDDYFKDYVEWFCDEYYVLNSHLADFVTQLQSVNSRDYKNIEVRNCGCSYIVDVGSLSCREILKSSFNHENTEPNSNEVEIPYRFFPIKGCFVLLDDIKNILKNRTTIKCDEIKSPHSAQTPKSVSIPEEKIFTGLSKDENVISKRKILDESEEHIQTKRSKMVEEEVIVEPEFKSETLVPVPEHFNSKNLDEPWIRVKKEDMGMEDPLKQIPDDVCETKIKIKDEFGTIETMESSADETLEDQEGWRGW
ncbi:hypothetical protein C0J52_07714 [Blattella germanica]|nr:hypothetical protein C0J52_07714 [Blattella germanica]